MKPAILTAVLLLSAGCGKHASGASLTAGDGAVDRDGNAAPTDGRDGGAPSRRDGATSRDGSVGAHPWAPDRFCERFLALACPRAVECEAPGFSTPERCEEELGADCARFERALADGVAAGRARYSPENARQCYEQLFREPCRNVFVLRSSFDEIPACLDAFAGLVPEGGGCRATVFVHPIGRYSDCAEGSCDASETMCPGTCRVARADGDYCDSSGACPDAFYCHPSLNRCTPRLEVGEACPFVGSCQIDDHCRNNVCVRAGQVGDRCGGTIPCDFGLRCLNEPEIIPRCIDPAPVGETCAYDAECATRMCRSNRCVELVGEGEQCPNTNYRVCEDDTLACIDHDDDPLTPKICGAPREIGQSCFHSYECVDGAFCWEQACRQRSARGGPCSRSSDCRDALYCDRSGDTNRCRVPGADGEPCPTGQGTLESCRDGLYCHQGSARCRPLEAEGGSCDYSITCQDRLTCLSGRCWDLGFVDDPCSADADCRPGLFCVAGACAPCSST